MELGAEMKIALLLPEVKATRYEAHDRPFFEKKVRALCPECRVLYSNADQSATRQRDQAETALLSGAQVLVLDPVDSFAAVAIVALAQHHRVPVISHDRLILNADIDYYVSFDNEQVGQLQAQVLADALTAAGKGTSTIVVLNGPPMDNNARLNSIAAHRVFDGSGLVIGAEYDIPDRDPEKAERQMEQALLRLGKEQLAGVYAANDGLASGAITALKAAGIASLPPVTGQDAELAAIQRILAGEQLMTVYKPIHKEAEAAAELAVALLRGQPSAPSLVNSRVHNGKKEVPAILLSPVLVNRENVRSTIISDGFWTAAQICTRHYQEDCKAARIQ